MLINTNLNNLKAAKGSKYEGYTFEQVKAALKQGINLPKLNITNGNDKNNPINNKQTINDPKYNLIKNMTMQELQELLNIKNTGVNKELNEKMKQLEALINTNNQADTNLNNIQNPLNNNPASTNNNSNINQPVNISQQQQVVQPINKPIINKDDFWQIEMKKLKNEVEAKENLLKTMQNKFNEQNRLIENDIIDNALRDALLKKGCIPESIPLLLRDPKIRSQFKADINTKDVFVLNPDGSDSSYKPDEYVEVLKTNFPEYRSSFNTYQGVPGAPNVAGGKDVSNMDADTRLSYGIHQMMNKKT
jgi:hypothetical protein